MCTYFWLSLSLKFANPVLASFDTTMCYYLIDKKYYNKVFKRLMDRVQTKNNKVIVVMKLADLL